MRAGDIVCAKSIEHRAVVEMREDKNGKQRPVVNRFGFTFQSEFNLLSEVGVFLFLGKYPEQLDLDVTGKFVEQQLKQFGYTASPEDQEPPS